MAPSATETPSVLEVPKTLVEKIIPVKEAKDTNDHSTKPVEKSENLAVKPLEEEKLPELLTKHQEPLKLSGALNAFDHFDVTPVIGREYSNINLVGLLRAPNSDELLRDLAITSKLPLQGCSEISTHDVSLPARSRLLPQAG